jgi:ABC-type multidrug transport system fused ATPase/permease subunit
LVTRVTTDVDVLNDLFASGVVAIFGDVFSLFAIVVVMLKMNWKLSLLTFSVLPIIVLVTGAFRKAVRDSYRRIRVAIARINAYLQEHITGMTKRAASRNSRRSTAPTWKPTRTPFWLMGCFIRRSIFWASWPWPSSSIWVAPWRCAVWLPWGPPLPSSNTRSAFSGPFRT